MKLDSDKSFGDFLFVIIASLIAWGTFLANKKSAQAATLALEEFRPKLRIEKITDSEVEIRNLWDFEASNIRVFYKKSWKDFVEYGIENRFLSAVLPNQGSESWKLKLALPSNTKAEAFSLVMVYRNASTNRVYWLISDIYSRNQYTPWDSSCWLKWLMGADAFERLLIAISLKYQIDSMKNAEVIESEIVSLLKE